jgi:hypothetical protein
MRGFIITSMVRGLGVDDQHNDLHEASVSIYEISFVRIGQNRHSTQQKGRTLDELQQQIRDTVAAALLTFNEKCRICVFQTAEVCAKYWGLC